MSHTLLILLARIDGLLSIEPDLGVLHLRSHLRTPAIIVRIEALEYEFPHSMDHTTIIMTFQTFLTLVPIFQALSHPVPPTPASLSTYHVYPP